ncbi:MAG: ankyrin repeat domain-containing protein, partial [Akkermansia sp.]|nr:ankyrin repeat domain-containing protein [Akkermansia sp.]
TALHNACGLSHTEIVCWLIEHGADLEAKTAKGATVDDCVGGANAKSIRKLLQNARSKKK